MPRKKSVAKSLRQSKKRYLINKSRKHKIKLAIKTLKQYLKEKKVEEAKKSLSMVYKQIDKAAKRFWHKNKAARLKSRFAKLLSKNIA
ncbi:MAG: 30S ribosomal protein S20 [Candidatus Parcubacteria bacterium]|nr:MAG: 30S ribosomal protein S20 [Candidatus Parcubacteria bacterium]